MCRVKTGHDVSFWKTKKGNFFGKAEVSVKVDVDFSKKDWLACFFEVLWMRMRRKEKKREKKLSLAHVKRSTYKVRCVLEKRGVPQRVFLKTFRKIHPLFSSVYDHHKGWVSVNLCAGFSFFNFFVWHNCSCGVWV